MEKKKKGNHSAERGKKTRSEEGMIWVVAHWGKVQNSWTTSSVGLKSRGAPGAVVDLSLQGKGQSNGGMGNGQQDSHELN